MNDAGFPPAPDERAPGERPQPELPPPTPPFPPRPFRPELAKSPVAPGCGKPIVIGCGLLMLLLLVAGMVFLTKAHDILSWTLKVMQPEVNRRLPDDLPAAERSRLDQAFQAAVRKARAETIDPAALQRVQQEFIALAGKEKLTPEEVRKFAALLEAFAHGTPAEADPEADDAADPEAPAPDADPPPADRAENPVS